MKIKDVKESYRNSMKSLQEKRREISKQRESLEKKTRLDPLNKSQYTEDILSLDSSLESLDKEYEKARSVMEEIIGQETAIANMEVAKQQGEAMKDVAIDEAKIFETARRIAKGDRVPGKDEEKVMEYSMELYMASKNAGMLARMRKEKTEEHESLWDDDDEKKTENPDPMEIAGNSEFTGETPEIDTFEE